MVEDNKIEKILCPICGVNTNHKVVWESKELGTNDEENEIWENLSFDVLQCLGCETPTLRKRYMFSEDLDIRNINGKNIVFPQITLWPKTGYRMLKLKYMSEAPPSVKRVYRETLEAYNNELQTLCAAGVRAIIESICKEKGIVQGDLKDKIDELRNRGLINEDFAEALHENRLLGNDALHESILFGDIELRTSIELIEAFIDIIYETKNKANLLKTLRESKKS